MEEFKYVAKEEQDVLALELLETLKPKQLPVWQVKDILKAAIRLADWHVFN